ncbi:hypothetical protein FPJ27_23115 [Burkholderia sp. MS455]|nr:hypothetical protein FPJ27_23115 [Burkholderia sp. MS455]
MHRRSPCRCTFCSRRLRPRPRRRPAGRRERRSGDYRRAKKYRRAPGNGNAAVGSRRAGAAAGPAGGVTAA